MGEKNESQRLYGRAAVLYARLLSGGASADDRRRLYLWLKHSPSYRQAFRDMGQIDQMLEWLGSKAGREWVRRNSPELASVLDDARRTGSPDINR